MKVSILQMHVAFQETNANQQTLLRLAAEAMEQRPDVLVLPELWSCGFVPSPLAPFADKDGATSQALLSRMARQYQVNIVGGSVPVLIDGKYYNRAYIFDRNGEVVAHYDKTHLFSLGGEDQLFTAGDEIVTFHLDGVKCGIATCYDVRFPEFVRQQALAGIQVLFVPAAWPQARRIHWRMLLRARAIENQIYVVACCAAGQLPSGAPLCGHSGIIDPWGEITASGEWDETIVHGSLTGAMLLKVRDYMDIYADRRKDLYAKPVSEY